MERGKLKKNTYFVAVGQIAHKVLAFALIPFSARILGEDGFGKFSLASSIMFFIFLFNDLGINTYITREIAKYKDSAEKFFFHSLIIKTGLILIDFALLLGFLKLANYEPDTNFAILIFAGYGITTSIMQLSIGIFEAHERMEFESIVLVLEKVIITSVGIWVLLQGYGLLVFCGAFLAGGVISTLSSMLILKKAFKFSRSNYKPEFAGIKSLVVNSMPFGIAVFISTIYNNIGILILSLIKTPSEVSWFSTSFKFIAITNLIPMVLVAATYPAFSREITKSKERVAELFTKCIRYLSFVVFPLIVGTIILAENIILLIYGEQYLNSIISLEILAWAAGLVIYNIFFTGILKAANLQNMIIKIQVIGLAINLVLNFTLIHFYSYIGAAISTVCTEAFIFLGFIWVTRRKITRLLEKSFFVKSIISTALMAAFAIYFKEHNVFAVVGGSVVIFFGSLFLMRGFALREFLPGRFNL